MKLGSLPVLIILLALGVMLLLAMASNINNTATANNQSTTNGPLGLLNLTLTNGEYVAIAIIAVMAIIFLWSVLKMAGRSTRGGFGR